MGHFKWKMNFIFLFLQKYEDKIFFLWHDGYVEHYYLIKEKLSVSNIGQVFKLIFGQLQITSFVNISKYHNLFKSIQKVKVPMLFLKGFLIYVNGVLKEKCNSYFFPFKFGTLSLNFVNVLSEVFEWISPSIPLHYSRLSDIA